MKISITKTQIIKNSTLICKHLKAQFKNKKKTKKQQVFQAKIWIETKMKDFIFDIIFKSYTHIHFLKKLDDIYGIILNQVMR